MHAARCSLDDVFDHYNRTHCNQGFSSRGGGGGKLTDHVAVRPWQGGGGGGGGGS